LSNHIQKILLVLNAPEKKWWGYLIFFSLMISLLDIISIALLLFIIGFYAGTLSYPAFSWMPPWLLNQQSLWLIGLFLFFFIVKSIAAYLLHAAQYKFVYRVALRIAGSKLLSYLKGNYTDFVKIDSSVHIRSISQQPIEFSQYVLAGSQLIITESILVCLSVVAILIYNAKVFVLLSLVLLPAVFLLAWLTRKRLKSVRAHVKQSGEKALQYQKEALSSYVEANIYDKHDFFVNRFSNYQEKLNSHLSDLQIIQGIPSRMIEVIAVLGVFILIAINKAGGNYQFADLISIGAFMAAAYKIIPGIVRIFNTSGQVKAYSFALEELLRSPLQEPKSNYNDFERHLRSIRFEDVSFSHDQKILDHFYMKITTGEMIGIAGNSGMGKTTLVNLLLGFLQPDNGRIIVNDMITGNSMQLRNYWPNISYVKQQTFLIHDSIEKNIILDETNYNERKLSDAIKISGLASIPGGIKKILAENGKDISGGQRQRIAIARAIYKNSDLFILDEPFNELDEVSEKQLLQYFKDLSRQGKMVILITHDKNSISYCDRIISLNHAKA